MKTSFNYISPHQLQSTVFYKEQNTIIPVIEREGGNGAFMIKFDVAADRKVKKKFNLLIISNLEVTKVHQTLKNLIAYVYKALTYRRIKLHILHKFRCQLCLYN